MEKGEVSDRVWQGINNKTTAIADFDTSTYWGIKRRQLLELYQL